MRDTQIQNFVSFALPLIYFNITYFSISCLPLIQVTQVKG